MGFVIKDAEFGGFSICLKVLIQELNQEVFNHAKIELAYFYQAG